MSNKLTAEQEAQIKRNVFALIKAYGQATLTRQSLNPIKHSYYRASKDIALFNYSTLQNKECIEVNKDITIHTDFEGDLTEIEVRNAVANYAHTTPQDSMNQFLKERNHTPILQAQQEPSETMKEVAKQLKQETAKDLLKATPFTGDLNRIIEVEVQQTRKFENLSEEEKGILRTACVGLIRNKVKELNDLVYGAAKMDLATFYGVSDVPATPNSFRHEHLAVTFI